MIAAQLSLLDDQVSVVAVQAVDLPLLNEISARSGKDCGTDNRGDRFGVDPIHSSDGCLDDCSRHHGYCSKRRRCDCGCQSSRDRRRGGWDSRCQEGRGNGEALMLTRRILSAFIRVHLRFPGSRS